VAPFNFGGPSLLDFGIGIEAENQPLDQPRSLGWRQSQRLSFQRFHGCRHR
jgi:hypothetical protein